MKELVLGAIAGALLATIVPSSVEFLFVGLCIVLGAVIIAEAIVSKDAVVLMQNPPVEPEKEERQIGFGVIDLDEDNSPSQQS